MLEVLASVDFCSTVVVLEDELPLVLVFFFELAVLDLFPPRVLEVELVEVLGLEEVVLDFPYEEGTDVEVALLEPLRLL